MKSPLSMARILCMITCMFILVTCQILSGEGRHINSPNKAGTNYVKSPFHRGIRKLSIQVHKSDQSDILPKKVTQQETSAYIFHPKVYEKSFPSLNPTHSSPSSSHKVDVFGVNKVDSIVESNCIGVKCSNDFEPTAQGRSPGAGHSIVTSTEKNSANQQTKDSKTQNSLAAPEEDLKHTGRSPGAGHVEEEKDRNLKTAKVQKIIPTPPTPNSFFRDSAMISKNDFQPPSPGSSPGVGRLNTNKRAAQGAGYCLSEKCTDSFRPTKPGDSPGAGHSYVSISNSITSEQGKDPSVVHPHEGVDDYRPTKPGHSPGAGHAVLDKREPNS